MRMLRAPIAAVILATLLACGGVATPPGPTPPAAFVPNAPKPIPAVRAAAPVTLTVVEDPAADRWRVEYDLDRPVVGVRFERHRTRFRAKRWTATVDGDPRELEWTTHADHEALVAKKPFSRLALTFATDIEMKDGDYLQNVGFTDGSRLFYTGHLALRALRCPGQPPCAPGEMVPSPPFAATDLRWRFQTVPGRDVLVLAERRQGSLDWEPRAGDPSYGTYVYFGGLPLLDVAGARAIVDPGMPGWMADAARSFIPRALDWFAKDTGMPLAAKPLVLVSFGDPKKSGRYTKGGGLPGVVQVSAWGDSWSDSADTRVPWLRFLGHELFHLWNGGAMVRTRAAEDAWLSEGSSELFAYRALRDLGLVDVAGYRDMIARATNHCLLTVQRSAVTSKHLSGRPEYPCGATLLAWVDGLAHARGQTVGQVFGRVLAKAAAEDGEYGTDDVLAEVERLGGEATAREPFEKVLRRGVTTAADDLFDAQLRRTGLDLKLVRVRDATLEQSELWRYVGSELARCDCKGGRVSYQREKEGFDYNDVPECNVLRGVRVVAIQGHAVPKDSLAAFEALVTRDPAKPVSIRLADRATPVALACNAAAHPPPFKRLFR